MPLAYCPNCGEQIKEEVKGYRDFGREGYYPWHCDCGASGRNWYREELDMIEIHDNSITVTYHNGTITVGHSNVYHITEENIDEVLGDVRARMRDIIATDRVRGELRNE